MKILRMGVAVAVVLVLSGCFGIGPDTDPDAGSGGGEQPTAPDFSQIAPFLLPADSVGENELVTNETAYGDVLNAIWWLTEYTSPYSIFDILQAWSTDRPATYFHEGEGPEVQWSVVAGGYNWIFNETIDLTLSDTETDISVTIKDIGGQVPMTLLSGNIAYDALSGSVTVFGEPDYGYSWGPSSIEDIRIEISFVSEVEQSLVIHTKLDGSSGQYQAFISGNPSSDVVSWPPQPE